MTLGQYRYQNLKNFSKMSKLGFKHVLNKPVLVSQKLKFIKALVLKQTFGSGLSFGLKLA